MYKSLLLVAFIFFQGLLFAQTTLVTDGSWKGVGNSAASGGTAWLFQGYDDSAWPSVEAPNAANVIPVVPGSQSIWVLPYSDTAKMRMTFVVPVGDSYSGSISINADNEFELFFNGVSQGFYNNWMGGPYTFVISPVLQGCVENVVAINAANWGGPYGASLSTTLMVTNPLNTPVAQPATNITCTSFTANWDTVLTASRYLLDVSQDPLFATYYSVYHDYNTGTNIFETLSGLPAYGTFYYRLRCQRISGIDTLTSCYSNTIQVDLDSLSYSLSATDTLCAGSPISLTASSAIGSTYGWSGPNGFTSANQNEIITNTSALNSGTYVLTISYPGCPTTYDSVQVEVIDNPPLVITPAGPYCSTASADTLVANLSGVTWSGTGITNTNLGIFDPAGAGGGNHSITALTGGFCPDTANMLITVSVDAGYTLSGSDSICEGDDIYLSSTSGLNATFNWSGPLGYSGSNNSDTIPNASTANSGSYVFTISYPACAPTFDTLQVVVIPYPNVNILPAGPFCTDDNGTFLSASPGGGIWSGPGITDANTGLFSAVNAGPGNHTVYYNVGGLCPGADTLTLVVANAVPLSSVKFPNVFTPNQDNINEIFAPIVPNGGHYKITIYDRWGVLLFDPELDAGWNGTIGDNTASEGIYYWIAEITSDCDAQPLVEKGYLHLFKP